MNVRDRLARDIEEAEKMIDFYASLGDDYDDKAEYYAGVKNRLQERADHYDREKAAGYIKPASQRNGKTISNDDEH